MHGQCDARPTVTFPSHEASPPFGHWYQIILLDDRGTCDIQHKYVHKYSQDVSAQNMTEKARYGVKPALTSTLTTAA